MANIFFLSGQLSQMWMGCWWYLLWREHRGPKNQGIWILQNIHYFLRGTTWMLI